MKPMAPTTSPGSVRGKSREFAARGARRVALATTLLALLALPQPAQARQDGAPAYSLGLADAVRASAPGASALFFNPACMAMLRQYSIEAGYSYLDDFEAHAIGASAVDSATNEFLAMGSAYTFMISHGKEKREGHQVRGGVASGYTGEGFGIHAGLGINYFKLSEEAGKTEYFTLDAGILLQIANMVRIGASAMNLIDTTQGRSGHTPAPRTVGLGATLNIDAFQLGFDAEIDVQTKWDRVPVAYMVGAQYLIESLVVIRAGFRADTGLAQRVRDTGHNDYVLAAGAGYVSRELGVDLAFEKSLRRKDGVIVGANFRYFLP